MTINKGATALLGAAALTIQIIAGSADASAQARHSQPSGSTSAPAHFSTPTGAVLYDQSGVVANGAATLNDGTEFSSRGADDFVVPDPNGWTVTGFNFQIQFEPTGAPASATYDLAVFPDAGGIPGATVMDGCKFLHADGALDASQTNLQVVLPTPCVLPTGSYWISFAANFEWPPQAYWSLSDDPTIGDEGTWENPGDGFASGCTMWMPLTTCGFAQKNYLFQIVGSVNGSAPCAGGGICLDVGVAVQDPANPDLCGTATSLDILAGQPVDFCYTVTNGSGLPLEFHSLTDNVNGQILDVEPASLAPGATLTHHRVATIDASQSVTSTWTALTELPGYDHTTGDLDPGMPSDCADRFFADGFDSVPLPCDGAIPGDFIDISTTGAALDLGDDDAVAFDMPFSFNLYGQTSNRLCIGNNGIVLFGIPECDTATFALNRPLPYDGFAGSALLPFWDDLFTAGNVYTQTIGMAPNRQFVVEWFEKDHFDDGSQGLGGVTFEVVFGEDGSLDYNYLKTTFEADPLWDDGGSATIGLQKNPAIAEEFSFETPSLRNLFFIDWTLRNPLAFTDTDDGVTINVSAPHIELPASLAGTSTAGTSTNVTLDIGNGGTSDLHWVLDEALSAAQGGSCANPADVPWLSMAPTSGTTAPSTAQPATVTLDATALAVGDYAATICVASDDPISPVVEIPVSFSVTAVLNPPTLTKSFAPASVSVSTPSRLTLTLANTNASPAALTAPLQDMLPTDVAVAPMPNALTTCGGALTGATAGSTTVSLVPNGSAAIPPNGSCIVRVDVRSATAGDFINVIPAGGLQTTAGTNATAASATLTVTPLNPPTVSKAFSPSTVSVNTSSRLRVTLGNSNSMGLGLASPLTDNLPVGLVVAAPPNASTTCGGALTASPGASSVTLASAGNVIPPNASCKFDVDVQSATAGDFANTIPIGALQVFVAGGNTTAATATLTVTPSGVPIAPTLTKAFAPAPVTAGTPSTLTITLANANATLASLTAALTDTFPAGLNVALPSNATTDCGGAVTTAADGSSITLDSLGAQIPASGTCSMSVSVVAATPGDYANTIAIGSLQTDAGNNAADASATLTVTAAPIAPTVAKAFAPAAVVTAVPSKLTITLANANATPATLSATFTDTFPAGLVVATAPNASTTCGGALNAPAGSGIVSLDNAGSSIPANGTCTIDVDVQAAAAGDYTNTIGAGSLQADSGTNATDASATLTVTAPIVPPTIDAALSPTSVAANASSTLTLTLGNSNAAAANLSADLVDTLPAGLVVASTPNAATTCGGAVNAIAGANTITLVGAGSAIPAGGTCTVSADVTAAVAGAYSNTLPVDALQTSAGNNDAAASDSVVVTGGFPAPYCASTALTSVEPITHVALAGIANLSSALIEAGGSATQSEDFLAIAGGALAPTGGYTITVRGATDGNWEDFVRAYFDWNHDGVFATDGSESVDVGSITNSTGNDAISTSKVFVVPPTAKTGLTRVRVVKAWSFYGNPCGDNFYGQAEDYLFLVDPALPIPPSPALSSSVISPNYLPTPGNVATLTLTLKSYNPVPLNLVSDFVDTLPAGLVVATPSNASTTCAGNALVAADGAGSFTLGSGSEIPANGTCSVNIDVTSATAGIYVNTIAAGAIQTENGGNPEPDSATVQFADPAGVPTYATGFEAPFVFGALNGQQGWYGQSNVTQPSVLAAAPANGAQHARLVSTSSTTTPNYPLVLSPVQPIGTSPYSILSANLRISRLTNGATWEFDPQDFANGLVVARVRFDKLAARNIQVRDFENATFVNTGAQWPIDTYFNLKVIVERATGVMDICMDGTQIFHDAIGSSVGSANITDAGILQTLQTGTTANNMIFVDDVVIDNSAIGTCSGVAPSPTTPAHSPTAQRKPIARSAETAAVRGLGSRQQP